MSSTSRAPTRTCPPVTCRAPERTCAPRRPRAARHEQAGTPRSSPHGVIGTRVRMFDKWYGQSAKLASRPARNRGTDQRRTIDGTRRPVAAAGGPQEEARASASARRSSSEPDAGSPRSDRRSAPRRPWAWSDDAGQEPVVAARSGTGRRSRRRPPARLGDAGAGAGADGVHRQALARDARGRARLAARRPHGAPARRRRTSSRRSRPAPPSGRPSGAAARRRRAAAAAGRWRRRRGGRRPRTGPRRPSRAAPGRTAGAARGPPGRWTGPGRRPSPARPASGRTRGRSAPGSASGRRAGRRPRRCSTGRRRRSRSGARGRA